MSRTLLSFLCLTLCAPLAWADKIIMKDGKIYQGHIMGETSRSILISNPPIDPKPRFIELKDVMTIVRESRPPETPSLEEGRFASLSLGLTGQFFSSSVFSLAPAPGFTFGGAFRLHPSVEVGGDMTIIPAISSDEISVTDGRTIHGYQSFYSYHGGFSVKGFPFFYHRDWRIEPYGIVGYHWNRLVPKASGDEFKGTTIFGGAGLLVPWWKPLYWDFRFVYEHTSYDSIEFANSEGSLSGVALKTFTLSAGLSYRFL